MISLQEKPQLTPLEVLEPPEMSFTEGRGLGLGIPNLTSHLMQMTSGKGACLVQGISLRCTVLPGNLLSSYGPIVGNADGTLQHSQCQWDVLLYIFKIQLLIHCLCDSLYHFSLFSHISLLSASVTSVKMKIVTCLLHIFVSKIKYRSDN